MTGSVRHTSVPSPPTQLAGVLSAGRRGRIRTVRAISPGP